MMGFHLEIQELEEALAEVDLVFHFDIFSSFGQSLFSQDGNGKLDYDEFVKMMLDE